ncbi:MAG: hypothetical protein ACLFTG_06545 [Alphaproteobacteria bacterium]
MADDEVTRARDWLHGWQGVVIPEGELGAAAGGAHGQVRALDAAVRRLARDDEPWRLRAVLARRARR